LIFSGDTGYQSGQEDQCNTVYDAQQKALADILGYRQNELATEQNLSAQKIAALQNAYSNYLAHPKLGGYGADASAGTTGTVGDPNAFATSAQIAAA
jgi:acid phosphatase class B